MCLLQTIITEQMLSNRGGSPALKRWLQLRLDFDSTVIRLPFDAHSTAIHRTTTIRRLVKDLLELQKCDDYHHHHHHH